MASWERKIYELFSGDEADADATVRTPYLSLAVSGTRTGTAEAVGDSEAWAADDVGDESEVSTAQIGGETYLDVRDIEFIKVKGQSDDGANAATIVVSEYTGESDDGDEIGSHSPAAGGDLERVVATDLTTANYIQITADQDFTIVVAGG